MTDFHLKNAYIKTSVRKRGIPGMAVSLEHTGVTQLIKEACKGKGDLVVLWLEEAYGSIPYKLV